jgi:hypothetical protein
LYYAAGANIACPTSQPALLCLDTGELSLQACGADTVVYPAAPLASCQVGQILGTQRAFLTTCPQPRTAFRMLYFHSYFQMYFKNMVSRFVCVSLALPSAISSAAAPAPSGSGTAIAITVIVLILGAVVGVWVWRRFYSDAGTSEENAALRSVMQSGVDGGSLN